MFSGASRLFDRYFPPARREEPLYRLLLTLIALAFVLIATVVIAFDSLFVTQNAITALQVGSIAPVDIRAPFSTTYISDVLTERVRDEAVDNINPFYDPPDPNVARQQLQLLRQIVDFIDNVRHDTFGTPTQKAADVNAISALTLDSTVIETILNMNDETWGAVSDEMTIVLERVMRESIRELELLQVADQLPTQVSLRLDPPSAAVVVDVLGDLIRPNRFPNAAATEAARLAAAQAVPPQSRSFEPVRFRSPK